MTWSRSAIVILACCSVLSGCGPDSSPAAGGATDKGGASKGALKDLVKTDIKVGTGLTVETGDTAEMEYTGTLKDGTVFDSNGPSKPDGMPFQFTVGAGSVIKGWDLGVPGMKEGGERKLEIPSDLAYGPADKGTIPPNSDLTFDIKLLAVVKKDQDDVYNPPVDTKVGTGPAVKLGDWVTITYKANYMNGKEFVSSPEGKPLEFQTKTGITPKGEKMQVRGLLYGLTGMKAGGVRELVLPPALAYSGTQQPGGPSKPTNLTLKYTINLLKVRPGTVKKS